MVVHLDLRSWTFPSRYTRRTTRSALAFTAVGSPEARQRNRRASSHQRQRTEGCPCTLHTYESKRRTLVQLTDRTVLVRSAHLVTTTHDANHVVHHALLGNPNVIDDETLALLNAFETPTSVGTVRAQRSSRNFLRRVRTFTDAGFLVRRGTDERAAIRRRVQLTLNRARRGENLMALGLILAEACNFGCDFCLARKLAETSGRQTTVRKMPWPVAQVAIDALVVAARAHGHKTVEIYFGGREPLLNWEVLQRSIEYALDTYGKSLTIRFSTNTNCSLITKERARFIAKHRILVTTSLDGLAEANDSVRTHVSGRGTFAEIIAGWDHLARVRRPIRMISLTLTEGNIDRIDGSYFDFLASRGIRTCTVEPDLIASLHRSPADVVDVLFRLRALGHDRGITVTGMWEKPFNAMIPSPKPKYHNTFACNAFSGTGLNVLPSGAITACSYSAQQVGTLEAFPSVLSSDGYTKLAASRAVGNIEACIGCEIEGVCRGGCYLTHEYGENTGSSAGVHYRCEIYRLATRALLLEAASDNASDNSTDGRR